MSDFSPYGTNLFGEPIEPDDAGIVAKRFTLPPFTVLDTKSGTWQSRRNAWLSYGIESEVGRDARAFNIKEWIDDKELSGNQSDVSIFDPVLCEMSYRWFAPPGGHIVDPFAGGSVRGIVAALLGYRYTGIDIRAEQVEANREQAERIVPDNKPTWIVGDAFDAIGDVTPDADLIFSCPPYGDLEVYSDDPDDLSAIAAADYHAFMSRYRHIIARSVRALADDRFAVFVVGDIRDRRGFYRNFVSDTIGAFQDAGAALYNEAILVNSVGTLAMRVTKQFEVSRKMGKQHQNVLVFCKGDPRAATAAIADRGGDGYDDGYGDGRGW